MPSFSSVRRAGKVDCSTNPMISVLSDTEYLMPRLPHPRSCFMGWPDPHSGDVGSSGVQRGANHEDCSAGCRFRQECFQPGWAQRVRRSPFGAGRSPFIVGMEACCGAHHLARVFAAYGHDVRLMSPEYVRPYVKAQKNDDRDAEGIAEAATRPTMRFVELKSQEQLDMQTLHRSRDRLVGERTALINQLRAILLERGIVVPQGKRKLEQFLAVLMDAQRGG